MAVILNLTEWWETRRGFTNWAVPALQCGALLDEKSKSQLFPGAGGRSYK